MTEAELQELIRLRNALTSVKPQAAATTEAPMVPRGLVGLPAEEAPLMRAETSRDIKLEPQRRQFGPGLTPQEWNEFQETFIGGPEKLPWAYPVMGGERVEDAVNRVTRQWAEKMSEEDFQKLRELEREYGVNPDIVPRPGRSPQSVQQVDSAPIDIEADRQPQRIQLDPIDIEADDGLDEDMAMLPPTPKPPKPTEGLTTRQRIAEGLKASGERDEAAMREQEARNRMQQFRLPSVEFKPQATTPTLDALMQQARRITSRL